MDELVNYVTETPENTNPNVVRSLASSISTAGDSSSGIMIVNAISDISTGTYTLDRTFREIAEAVKTGPVIIYQIELYGNDGLMAVTSTVTNVYYEDSYFYVQGDKDYYEFTTEVLDGYPSRRGDSGDN